MNRILVANRGEIAMRVLKTCKDLGISTMAVYSEADRGAPFVRYADEAVCLGPAPSTESYLNIDKIIEVCLEHKIDGVHPGYGFLSENSEFAEKLEASGITFIGPSSHAIEVMGSKLAAKEAVSKYDIPMVPGSGDAVTDIAKAKKIAEEIGFPVLVKASAGGGGKGMRIVEHVDEFEAQLERAQSEARSAFGDDAVFIEKFVTSPRHIEIQVLADKHGNAIHLFERECSIQRRHQKVVEEAPSSVLTPELRDAMGKCAVDVARSCDYVGAGTVEFLLDDKHNFYFLEMNTRLQVEHPVTELITGIDLVKEQISIARGEKLSFSQEEIAMSGHALELRVYAENPYDNFLPDTGNLQRYEPPKGPGVRVDDGYEEGMDIPIYYDPMIAKLITYGENREEAIDRMLRAIQDYNISGVQTTLPFGTFAVDHEAFRSGDFDTNFVSQYYSPEAIMNHDEGEESVAATLVNELLKDARANGQKMQSNINLKSNWKKNRKEY